MIWKGYPAWKRKGLEKDKSCGSIIGNDLTSLSNGFRILYLLIILSLGTGMLGTRRKGFLMIVTLDREGREVSYDPQIFEFLIFPVNVVPSCNLPLSPVLVH